MYIYIQDIKELNLFFFVCKGHLHTYRFCDEVWTFIIENPNFKFDQETISADKVKIVACNAKRPGEQ